MRASRRPVATLVALCHLLASATFALPSTALAQSGDTDPPRIEFEPIDEGVRGDTQVVSAGITDDIDVDSATLHYRLDPEGPYRSLAMEPLGGTSIYSASVETADTGAEVLQYYVEARRRRRQPQHPGLSPSDPLERVLVDADAAAVVARPRACRSRGSRRARRCSTGGCSADRGGGWGGRGREAAARTDLADDPGGHPGDHRGGAAA